MTPPHTPHPDLERFLDLLAAPDRSGALALVRRARDQTTTDALIAGLLSPALRRVGELWQVGAWNVAQEHAATSIVDAALADLELAGTGPGDRGEVVVACAEGEWHVLPARMAAQQLRGRGWAVVFVGASTPADHLRRLLTPGRTVGLLVSCSVSAVLVGAQRSIEAGHAAGIPVLAGGAGFGPDDRRALVLGADGYAADGLAADAVLGHWVTAPPSLGSPSGSTQAALELAARRGDLVDAALRAAGAGTGPDDDEVRDRLDLLVQFIEAALLCGDRSVVTDALPWFEDVIVSRGRPSGTLAQVMSALVDALPPSHTEARALLGATAAPS